MYVIHKHYYNKRGCYAHFSKLIVLTLTVNYATSSLITFLCGGHLEGRQFSIKFGIDNTTDNQLNMNIASCILLEKESSSKKYIPKLCSVTINNFCESQGDAYLDKQVLWWWCGGANKSHGEMKNCFVRNFSQAKSLQRIIRVCFENFSTLPGQ